jgi:hypothetical protein
MNPQVPVGKPRVTLTEDQRAAIQAQLDNHALETSAQFDQAIEDDKYDEAARCARIMTKTVECLQVLTK